MKKIIFTTFIFTTILFSCKYRPFIKYYLPDKATHLPKFKKWDRFVGSNSNPLRTCYDITCYDWSVGVFPKKEIIKSRMIIHFKMECDQDTILLDLQSNMKIDTVRCGTIFKKVKRKKNSLFIVFNRNLKQGEKAKIEISYHGKPHVLLGNSTLFWKKDKNEQPWICTSTEGLGPDQLMPCKNLLYDEPDSCFIRIKVPKGLVAVANGKLDSVSELENSTQYNWSVHNPINIYNISFNVGKYVKLEKNYTDINKVSRKIEVYALDYNKDTADIYYNQAPIIMRELEKLYGVYPWWNDGCRFIETCLKDGDCMEHQSAISMGDNYNMDLKEFSTTLVHELSHEWWGNNITGYDYADIWLHEGFATYSEALVIEALIGKDTYDRFMYRAARWTGNKRPILKTRNVAYKSWISDDDSDIYGKAGLFIHTLRIAVNDDTLFFSILKSAQLKFSKSTITTAEFMAFFNEQTKRDFTPYFDTYLKEYTPPTIEFKIDTTHADSTIVSYRWKNELPKGINLNVIMSSGDKYFSLIPTTTFQTIKFTREQKFYFEVMKTGYYSLVDVSLDK